MLLSLLCLVSLHGLGADPQARQPAAAVAEASLETLNKEATALEPLVTSNLAKNFLKATERLSPVSPRTLYLDESTKNYQSQTSAAALSQDQKSRLKRIDLDASFYWNTKYGSPLAYARALDVLGQSGLENVGGLKILDFGYGTIGHLRLLAGLGADVTGVDVDPLLHALYSADQGPIKNPNGPHGKIRLIHGRFPAESAITTAVGRDYDLFISKNTLKKGYVHPDQTVDPRRLLNLAVDDVLFVKSLHQSLKPGARVLIYNISPAPSPPGQPYKNWADGRCPFSKDTWEKAGFRVLAFDHDDSEAARAIGHALGWDQGDSPIDLKSDLFAMYSLMQRVTENTR